ncbi:hypothetical protein [Streptomyces sp. NPDC055287]
MADLPTEAQAVEPVEAGEGTLGLPLGAQAGAAFGVSSGDLGFQAQGADQTAAFVVVVSAVASTTSRRRTVGPGCPDPGGTAWSNGISWVTSFPAPPVNGTAR